MIYLLIFAIFYFVFVKTIICLVQTFAPDYSFKYPPRKMNKKLRYFRYGHATAECHKVVKLLNK